MIEDPTKEQEERRSAPFNFAIATLERINEILRDIKNLSLNKDKLHTGINQKKKLDLIRDLLVHCSPLLKNKEKRNEIWKQIKELNMEKTKVFSSGSKISINKFSQNTEDKLNEIIMDIEDELQETGYFMPEKSEAGLF